MSATTYVRPAAEAECDEAAKLISAVIRGCELYPEEARERMSMNFDMPFAWLADDPESVLLAFAGFEPVGFAISDVNAGVCHLYWIGVVESQRGTGIGRALLTAVIDGLAARGAHKLTASVLTTNVPSQRLMWGSGLHVACELRQHFDHQDYLLFETDPLPVGVL